MQFTHLHVHSQYSLLDGKAAIPELVDKAIAQNMNALALTDHGNMFGIKEFVNYCAKVNGGRPEGTPPFKPILGCEMYVAWDKRTDRKDRKDNGDHLIVLAKNLTGYRNLCKLVSHAWTEGFYSHPRTDHDDLAKYREGLIICSACLGGEVPQAIIRGDLKKAEETMLWYKETFGDDYYVELQRHKTDKPNANTETYQVQQDVNKVLVEMARKHGIKLIATNDVHFTNEEDGEAHDRLICVSMQKTFSEPRMHYTKQEWLKSTEQMAAIFADLPEALENTQEIVDKVEIYSIDHAPIMPNFEIPADFGTEEEYRSRISEKELYDEFTQDENGNVVLSEEEGRKKIERLGGYDKLYRIKFEADYLNFLTMKGAKKRYGDPLPEDVAERLKFELYIMKTMGFPGYFLIVQDFISAGRDQLGVSIGPGRGSAAGSCAAYCLGITQIDPIKYDLLFERFLNPDRISLPDIDVDFDDDGRKEVLKYVTKKYGAEKVAHIITYQTMATKMVIKDVAKVMELSVAEGNRLARLVPDRLPEINGKAPKINFKNCLKYVKEFKDAANSDDSRVREVMNYAEQLEGNVRGIGVHACGVIIGRDDITDWVPVSTGTDPDGERVIVTQYEGSVIEETGMIKMDFLGLKNLSIIKEALANIKQTRGIDVDIDNIPLDDPKTYELYSEGNTIATFQFESPQMRAHLKELKPTKFEDLIAMNALYRPGPMAYIPSFIARKHGREPISYDIPIMEKYLKETYGITVYQEQVMLLSRLLANFTRGESDMLRKAMGKKQIDKMAKLKVKFMSEGQKNGYTEQVLEKIWTDWEAFASYAFNKSHATCYSWVAYQTGYLKANYPSEYMAGVLSRNLTASDKLKRYMDECIRMGINVKGPDINESFARFGVNKAGEIRLGLGAVKGVGLGAVNAILKEREDHGPYKDIFDFIERVNLSACNRSSIENLAMAGAFDCFPDVKREMFVTEMFDSTWSDILVKFGQQVQAGKNSNQGSLFDDCEEEIEVVRPPFPKYEAWDPFHLLEKEKELVNLYLSAHPLDPYYMEIKYGCNTPCSDYSEDYPEGKELTIGGLVTSFQTKMSKTGKPYGVIEIEDFKGKNVIRIFGKNYDNWQHKFLAGRAYRLTFKFMGSPYKSDRILPTLTDVTPLDDLQGQIANKLTLYIEVHQITDGLFETLQSMEGEKRPGDLYLNVFDIDANRLVKLHSRKPINLNRELVKTLNEWEIRYEIS